MKPAIRTQVDEKQRDYSRAASLDCSDLPDTARQEFREEADANKLLARYGINVPVQRTPSFGDADFDLDLHSAFIAVDRAEHAFTSLPTPLRQKYKTTGRLLDAMNTGELEADLRAEREKREKADKAAKGAPPASTPPAAPSAAPAASEPPQA